MFITVRVNFVRLTSFIELYTQYFLEIIFAHQFEWSCLFPVEVVTFVFCIFRLVVEGECVNVYHTLENSRVYHETELDHVEFGLEVSWWYWSCIMICLTMKSLECFPFVFIRGYFQPVTCHLFFTILDWSWCVSILLRSSTVAISCCVYWSLAAMLLVFRFYSVVNPVSISTLISWAM